MATTASTANSVSTDMTPEPNLTDSEPSDSDNDGSINSTSTRPSSGRKRKRRGASKIWAYARRPIPGVEPKRGGNGMNPRRYWYCNYPECSQYSCLSTNGAREHLKNKHYIDIGVEALSSRNKIKQQDLRMVVSKQRLQQQEFEDIATKQALRSAANPAVVRQALLRLIARHDLPVSIVEWPELHTFVHTINHEAQNCIWNSHITVTRHLKRTYETKRKQLAVQLQQAKTSIHLTTDTWHSPNFKEFQAITGHFVSSKGQLCKALLALQELHDGHAGEQVAPLIIQTLESYGIKDKLGYVTADNHGANDTLCQAISEQLVDWDPIEGRLRCFGHMVNVCVHAFLFAKNKAAVDAAIEHVASQPSNQQDLDDELTQLSQKDGTGWILVAPLQKVINFVRTLRTSDRLYQAFRKLAGRSIRAPVITRWNSFYATFKDATALRGPYSQLVLEHSDQLSDFELSAAEWSVIDQTVTFLQPFEETTKLCEGDYVTLDKVQLSMDSLGDHFKEQAELYKANESFATSILTGWYAFDKYYKLVDKAGAYAAALLLHPERRKAYLTTAWHRDWVPLGIERARKLWLAYKGDDEVEQPEDDITQLSYNERWLLKLKAKQKRFKPQDEFDKFINAPQDDIGKTPVIDWWQEPAQQRTYPQLSRVAIEVLSACAMSAESERVFSGTRRVIPWSRARLESDLIEILESLKHWLASGIVDSEFDCSGDEVE